jgi:hypothetical protein
MTPLYSRPGSAIADTSEQSAPTPSSATSPSTTLTSASSASPPPRTLRAAPRRTASRSVGFPPGRLGDVTILIADVSSLPPRPLRHRLRRSQALVAAQVNHAANAVCGPPHSPFPAVRHGNVTGAKGGPQKPMDDGKQLSRLPPPARCVLGARGAGELVYCVGLHCGGRGVSAVLSPFFHTPAARSSLVS